MSPLSTPSNHFSPAFAGCLFKALNAVKIPASASISTEREMMKQHQKLTVVLCLTWILTLLYGEMLAFWIPYLSSCSSAMDGAGDNVKIAVIADPQLMDRTSLGLPSKSLALEIAQFYTDLYMRRAFFTSILPFKPNIILFLGDHFDGGPYLSDEEWQQSLSRFKHIFGLNNQQRYRDIQVHYIPGNHDIGYAILHSYKPEVIKRYEKEFGMRNYRFTAGKVEFLAVDSLTLDGHQDGNLASATWDFIKNVSVDVQLSPRVLLTHIPLYRRDWTPCGPHRRSPVINQWISHAAHNHEIQYQNYITEESSQRVLDMIKPVLVLSGHDHDQCTVIHKSNSGTIKEHTLGTISWQQGNLYPSFMLLSASNSALLNTSNLEEAVSTHLCFLPMQTHIYIGYILLFILTLLSLLAWPTCVRFWRHCSDLVGSSKQLISRNIFQGGTKEKNEDENCEYEMIWDAEGSMHLVKKPVNTPIKNLSDKGAVERGNAVMRPTAKKIIPQEMEVRMNVDTNVDDSMTKLPIRTSKSKIKFIIHRLVQAFGMLIVIAAVNIPLYMMLLFKDWIEQ